MLHLQRYFLLPSLHYESRIFKKIRINDPKCLAILTQIRVGLSKQNFYKFRHNFRDAIDPMCPSNDGVEDTEHYLFLCQSYEESRRELLNGLNAILLSSDISNLSSELLVELILYGNELPPDANTRFFYK